MEPDHTATKRQSWGASQLCWALKPGPLDTATACYKPQLASAKRSTNCGRMCASTAGEATGTSGHVP